MTAAHSKVARLTLKSGLLSIKSGQDSGLVCRRLKIYLLHGSHPSSTKRLITEVGALVHA